MNIKKLQANLSLCILFVFLHLQLFAQNKTEQVIASLNTKLFPIETLAADDQFKDIDFLKETLKDKEVIALGEATHGTKEIFEYKDRLVRFLVLNLGFKAIAFESDFTALEAIDDYINGDRTQLNKLSGTPLHIDNLKMLEWLKKYNSDQSPANRVHVYGLEARAFNNISARILSIFPNLTPEDRQLLEKLRNTSYRSLTKKDLNLTKQCVTRLRSNSTNPLHQHYVELLNQNIAHLLNERLGENRDAYMAKNASWIKERTANGKLIVWAHNGHVAKSKLYSEGMMGMHLYKKYNTKYFVIATDFNQGEVSVMKQINRKKTDGNFKPLYYPEVSADKAYEFYFKQCRVKNFIIDVNSAVKDPVLNDFFNKPFEMRLIGATSTPVNKKLIMTENFDLIVYFDKTTSI